MLVITTQKMMKCSERSLKKKKIAPKTPTCFFYLVVAVRVIIYFLKPNHHTLYNKFELDE